jgi:hypothetical protein
VDGGRGRLAGGGRLRLQPAQQAPDARQQFAQVEGLGDVVVSAQFQADDAIDEVAGSRHHDDPEVVVLAQVARQRQPVLAGQAQVQQHGVRQFAFDLLAHLQPVRGLREIEAVALEILAQHGAHGRIVVDHQ